MSLLKIAKRTKTYPNALMHDFGDGNGPVPAHRHPNGLGIVADTAHVGPLVHVGIDACVYGEAKVKGAARISHNSRVCDRALINGRVCVENDARVEGDARVLGDAFIIDKAVVRGHAKVYESAEIAGETLVDGEQEIGGLTCLEQWSETPPEPSSVCNVYEDEKDSEHDSSSLPTRANEVKPVGF